MDEKEMQELRFFGAIETGKVYSTESLLNKINFLLPSNLTLNTNSLRTLIAKQQTFKVFRCHTGDNKIYYIFKKRLSQ